MGNISILLIFICGCMFTVSGASVQDALLGCHIKQTMAWGECRMLKCPSTCQEEADCTFPYCDSRGICQCRKAWCKWASSCDFFGINCAGNFTCNHGNCQCHL